MSDDHILVLDSASRGCGNNTLDCFKGKLFGSYYRPVVAASFSFVQRYHLHNNDPDGFHLENLVIHSCVVALALWLFRILLRRRAAALIAGALFAFHPIQVPITTFIGGRTDSLALLFSILFAIGLANCSRHMLISKRASQARHRLRASSWFWMSFVGLLAALFTKEQTIGLVLLAPLIAALGSRVAETVPWRMRTYRPRSTNSYWLIAYAFPVLVYIIMRRVVLGGERLADSHWSLGLHLEMIGRTLWYYVKAIFLPTLTTQQLVTLGSWAVPQYGVVLLGYGFCAVWMFLLWRWWSDRSVRLMMLWASLTLAPCLNIVPLPSQYVAPFRVALPLFGLAGLVGYQIDRFSVRYGRFTSPRRVPICALIIVPVLVWCIAITLRDVPNWSNDLSRDQAQVNADPGFIPGRAYLANCLLRPSDSDTPDYQKAANNYSVCLDQLFGAGTPVERYPSLVNTSAVTRTLQAESGLTYDARACVQDILRERGSIRWQLGLHAEALMDYKALSEMAPPGEPGTVFLANSYLESGDGFMRAHDSALAAESYRAALQLVPNSGATRAKLARAYRAAGLPDRATAVEKAGLRASIVP